MEGKKITYQITEKHLAFAEPLSHTWLGIYPEEGIIHTALQKPTTCGRRKD